MIHYNYIYSSFCEFCCIIHFCGFAGKLKKKALKAVDKKNKKKKGGMKKKSQHEESDRESVHSSQDQPSPPPPQQKAVNMPDMPIFF